MSSGFEGTTQSAPESPVTRLIETPTINLPSTGTTEEPGSDAADQAPAAAEDVSNIGGSGNSSAEGSKGPSVRLDPFQSMPRSTQEELGKELFDDPLLSIDNVKKLTDCMQWSFKYTKVRFLLLTVRVE